MKFLVYSHNGGAPQAGVLVNDHVISIAGCGYPSLLPVIEGGAAAAATIQAHLAQHPGGIPVSQVKLHAPIPNPPKLFMIGLNYRDHAIESGMAIPTTPTVFNKFDNSIIGPGDTIVLPKATAQPDYEAEFAFVIGKKAKHVKGADWKEYVFGYTIINDVSARDLQLASPQWLMGKACDTFCPMGPTLVTADEIANPHNLRIGLRIGDEVLQDSSTKELIFDIPALLEYMTKVITLEPGDIISTGTPPGVGFARKPPRYLRAGDVCTVFVEGLGELTNPVTVEA